MLRGLCGKIAGAVSKLGSVPESLSFAFSSCPFPPPTLHNLHSCHHLFLPTRPLRLQTQSAFSSFIPAAQRATPYLLPHSFIYLFIWDFFPTHFPHGFLHPSLRLSLAFVRQFVGAVAGRGLAVSERALDGKRSLSQVGVSAVMTSGKGKRPLVINSEREWGREHQKLLLIRVICYVSEPVVGLHWS